MKRYLSFQFLPLYALLLCTQNLRAGDLDDVIHAMREGNFAEAYCILKPYADDGDADAQYNIGWMYLNGYGLAINDSLALEWWQRASEQGHIDASFSIAMLYNLGEGQVQKDMGKAIDYYLLAAEEGHEDARLILRSMLQRNDKSIRERKQQIINTYGSMLGELQQVKSDRVNVRSGPGVDNAIVTSLRKGDLVLNLGTSGNWTNVILEGSAVPAWIYSTLLEDYVPVEQVDVAGDADTGQTSDNDVSETAGDADVDDKDVDDTDADVVDTIEVDASDYE